MVFAQKARLLHAKWAEREKKRERERERKREIAIPMLGWHQNELQRMFQAATGAGDDD
jgi:hypothetical protein